MWIVRAPVREINPGGNVKHERGILAEIGVDVIQGDIRGDAGESAHDIDGADGGLTKFQEGGSGVTRGGVAGPGYHGHIGEGRLVDVIMEKADFLAVGGVDEAKVPGGIRRHHHHCGTLSLAGARQRFPQSAEIALLGRR